MMSKLISNIVFTKNRPLQLDAYLESLYKHLPSECIQTYVIYKDELFAEEYNQLFNHYSDCIVIREKNFHSDFLQTLDQIQTEYILFGVDDVVYFDSVDMNVIAETFTSNQDDILGFSLRLNPDLLSANGDVLTDQMVCGQKVYRVDWTKGQTVHSRYPFELCSTVYRTSLVKKVISSAMTSNAIVKSLFSPGRGLAEAMAKVVSRRTIHKRFGYFFCPNTLESWNCRWCRNHSEDLPAGLYLQKPCASAIQVNLVNTSTDNLFYGDERHTVEALNERYREGARLDLGYVAENRPGKAHCGPEFFRLTEVGQAGACKNSGE